MKSITGLRNLTFTIIASVFVCALTAAPAQAQRDRSWVSTNGDDTKPCSHQEPCKTFAGAITKTNEGGEIVALDSGGYGAVTIKKSITIDGGGVYAGINDVSGIDINAGAQDKVILRGLTLHGTFQDYGVFVTKVGSLFIEGCTINGWAEGVLFSPANSTARLYVKDTIFRANDGAASVASGGRASFDHCRAEDNGRGFSMNTGSGGLSISDCLISGNRVGIELDIVEQIKGRVTVESCVVAGNGTGIEVGEQSLDNNGKGIFFVSQTMLTNNETALDPGLGEIISFGNNRLAHNTNDGAFTSTKPQQ